MNSIVNSARVEEWTAELTIIASNENSRSRLIQVRRSEHVIQTLII